MKGMAKGILLSIFVSIAMMIFFNFIYFFPWYMTLVVQTFNLSQTLAMDNYMKQSYYDDALENLREKPVFKERPTEILITVENSSGYSAIGNDDATIYEDYSEWQKPYKQRGEPITIRIEAVYLFSVSLWGENVEAELPASFSITTVGLKHYKDLEFY